jgi:outer membrane lipoprotein SlyB
MWGTGVRELVIAAGTSIVLGGCQMVGPVSIDQGRDSYNHIIQSTAKEQTLSNIVRVFHHEPTAFMDVTEVDATTTFSGNVSGGVAGIGARAGTSGGTLAGQVGAVAGGVTYSESPLIRYQPLLGQSLVAQLATPVSPDVIWSLYDSNWGIAPILDLSTSYLVPDYDETGAALNTIAQLDLDDTLELVAEKSEVTKTKDSPKTGTIGPGVTLEVSNKSSGAGGTDALGIYFLSYHPHGRKHNDKDAERDRRLWKRLRDLYAGTQVAPTCPSSTVPLAKKCSVRFDYLELRTTPLAPAKMSPDLRAGAPIMRTFSALGILKNATEKPRPRIAFVDFDRYVAIRSHAWNDPKIDVDLNFYTLLPGIESEGGDENEGDEKPPDENAKRAISKVDQWLRSYTYTTKLMPRVYLPSDEVSNDDFVMVNQRLFNLRRYILVIKSDIPAVGSYVAHFDHGAWYYIAGDDEVSQKTST